MDGWIPTKTWKRAESSDASNKQLWSIVIISNKSENPANEISRYEREMAEKGPTHKFKINWNNIRLKEGIEEGKDYYLISF